MNIAIIYGGESVESDVSVLTALHLAKNIGDDINAHLVYICGGGQMVTSKRNGVLKNVDYYLNPSSFRGASECFFAADGLYKKTRFGARRAAKIDVVINCCHGGAGEDGRLAGMFEILNIPVTSSPPSAAAAIQSKSRTREILTQNAFSQPKFQVIKSAADPITIPLPFVVKPDNLGSSIGITIVRTEPEIAPAVELAFTFDTTVTVEEFIPSADEINCSAFYYRAGSTGRVLTSVPEIIKKDTSFFDFETKYLNTQSGFIKKGAGAAETHPAFDEIKKLTARAYEIFNCAGVVRADFLVAGERVILNEINSVPGFFAYHLWLKSGLPYSVLIEMLTEQAVKNAQTRKKLHFSSEILQKNRDLVD
jgi:D-alanine-D-alanine ligase